MLHSYKQHINVCRILVTIKEWLFEKGFIFISPNKILIVTYKKIEGCRMEGNKLPNREYPYYFIRSRKLYYLND